MTGLVTIMRRVGSKAPDDGRVHVCLSSESVHRHARWTPAQIAEAIRHDLTVRTAPACRLPRPLTSN